MKYIVTEIGKGKYGALGDLTSEGIRTPFVMENLFRIGDGDGETIIIGNEFPKIITFNAGYDSGFTYNVYAKWRFGEIYELTKTITLSPSDETFDRIDIIAVNNVGNIVVIEGTPGLNPKKPDIDPNTQLEGTFVYITAGSTSPDKVVSVMVYDENVPPEWIPSADASIDFESINDFYSGSISVEGTNVGLYHSFNLDAGEMVDFINVKQLNFRLKNKKALTDTLYTHVVIIDGLDVNGNSISKTLPDSRDVGFTNVNTSDYQYVSLPISASLGIAKAQRIRFVFQVDASVQWGFFLDKIQIVEGTDATIFEETDPTVSAYTKTLVSPIVLLNEIKTVDGTGSGLDADLLDGRDSEYYDHTLPGYLTEETDPVFTASPAFDITETNISNWDTAYGWGDHALEGYLKDYTETDPIFTASPAFGITLVDISEWDEAFSWGDHSTMGYLTAVDLPVIDTGVMSVTGDLVDNTDPKNPVINPPYIPENVSEFINDVGYITEAEFDQDNKIRMIYLYEDGLPTNYTLDDIAALITSIGLTIGDKEVIAWEVIEGGYVMNGYVQNQYSKQSTL